MNHTETDRRADSYLDYLTDEEKNMDRQTARRTDGQTGKRKVRPKDLTDRRTDLHTDD